MIKLKNTIDVDGQYLEITTDSRDELQWADKEADASDECREYIEALHAVRLAVAEGRLKDGDLETLDEDQSPEALSRLTGVLRSLVD